MVALSINPTENGTIVITVFPTDEDGVSLTAGDLIEPQWQLMRTDGTVINGRTFEASNMTDLQVVLTGEDLAILGLGDSGRRVFSFQAKYDSDIGAGLHITAERWFTIQDLVGQE